jgi:small conductance mechanosensitive channel
VFHTILVTNDNREITIPNGQIIAAPIENLTVLGRRRVDLIVSVEQGQNLAKVRDLLAGVIAAEERFHRSPPPAIDVAEITDTAVKLQVRPWTTCDDYAKVSSDAMEKIKTAMDAAGLKYAVAFQAAA